MKNFLKKLHIGASSEDSDGSNSSSPTKGYNNGSPQSKPFSAISGWLNSVRHSNSLPSSRGEKMDPSDSLDAALEAVNRDSGSSSHDVEVEEEYQIQLALELSAREDPEAVQIEAVKQISLGSCSPDNTPAEIVAFRYWNYNALNYDDKIPDGFYDLYGVLTESSSSKMPSLVDLQSTSIAGNINWEAVLVNRAADTKLLNLEEKALQLAVNIRSHSVKSVDHFIVQKLASLVSEHMGGPVGNPERMLMAWRDLSHSLKTNHGSVVLPLGSLTIGMARHRALLFKVLADSLGVPCRLVKGRQFTGSDDVAMNFVKIDDEREYIVDLMSDPGTLIPSDAAASHEGSSNVASFSGAISVESKFSENNRPQKESTDTKPPLPFKSKATGLEKCLDVKKEPIRSIHARSPSWTEGVSSPAVRRMKVKDVSQYMIDAAKDNPQLAQKLHDVLLESGVVAPPDLFIELYPDQLDMTVMDKRPQKQGIKNKVSDRSLLPPLHSRGIQPQIQPKEHSASSESETGSSNCPEKQNLPVAAAAAAAAAVVASSMVVAAAKSSTDPKLHLPVAAAATATAAAVVATTTAVNMQRENFDNLPDSPSAILNQLRFARNDGESVLEPRASGEQEAQGNASEGDRASNRSTGNESSKSDTILDDVADCEIPWEDISLGERIGLGSYGEVYRGDWHGTEVAVKKFLDQNITCESLEEFKSEVLIMRRVRHPNVVLFMGAITRPPNLSIVTEFLPRGSLYRLIHRPNNQVDERRRLRMALDAARGMNYLHNCTPMIVHRDLKSPNLLVDKNWVVKVCDFGLSRMKHSTFLSSRSAAGTAEWMAPEVLRNEPSNEKCDVYSFGVILWELCTLQQPWGGLNPMQVVGAVGFQHRRLDIPDNMDPVVADLIRKCWETDPKLRPSFADIMAALKPLQKPITSSQSRQVSRGNEKVQRSFVNLQDPGDQS